MAPLPPSSQPFAGIYIAGTTVLLCGQGGIYAWDGTQWHQESSTACYAIHGVGSDTVYAVGPSPNSVMKRDSGGQWTSDNQAAVRSMNSVYVAAPNDVWLVGGTSTSLMAHWDGSAWATIDSGLDSPARLIIGSGSKNLWLTGDSGAILRQRR
jgi:photosystem II stability/assembly factor-like uncharacterized protein